MGQTERFESHLTEKTSDAVFSGILNHVDRFIRSSLQKRLPPVGYYPKHEDPLGLERRLQKYKLRVVSSNTSEFQKYCAEILSLEDISQAIEEGMLPYTQNIRKLKEDQNSGPNLQDQNILNLQLAILRTLLYRDRNIEKVASLAERERSILTNLAHHLPNGKFHNHPDRPFKVLHMQKVLQVLVGHNQPVIDAVDTARHILENANSKIPQDSIDSAINILRPYSLKMLDVGYTLADIHWQPKKG